MSILMLNPVILPSSRKVVDRFVFLPLDVSPLHVHPQAGPRHSPLQQEEVVDRLVFLSLDVSPHHVHLHAGPCHSPLQQEGCRQGRISALDVSPHHVHPHAGPRHSPLQQEGSYFCC
jgi:hypothetical protein